MVVKEGSWRSIYGRLDAEIKSDCHDYFLTEKVVKGMGFRGRKAFADKEKVLAFCKAFDKYVEMKNGEWKSYPKIQGYINWIIKRIHFYK